MSQGSLDDGGEIPPSPLLPILRPDPNKPSGRVVLKGYPGPANDDTRIRLYLGLAFTSYYELNRDDILGHWSADTGDPNAPIHVVIEPTTKFDLIGGSNPASAGSFLQGEIVSNNLAKSLKSSIDVAVMSFLAEALTIPSCAYKSCNPCD